jgi:hypothetical protein
MNQSQTGARGDVGGGVERMGGEHFATIGAEYRKESQRLLPRALIFGLLLLMSHVLQIKPSDVDVGGIRVSINDIVVVRGFLFYFWSLVSSIFEGSFLLPMETAKRAMRSLIWSARKPYRPDRRSVRIWRNPKQVKRFVWWAFVHLQYVPSPLYCSCVGDHRNSLGCRLVRRMELRREYRANFSSRALKVRWENLWVGFRAVSLPSV